MSGFQETLNALVGQRIARVEFHDVIQNVVSDEGTALSVTLITESGRAVDIEPTDGPHGLPRLEASVKDAD